MNDNIINHHMNAIKNNLSLLHRIPLHERLLTVMDINRVAEISVRTVMDSINLLSRDDYAHGVPMNFENNDTPIDLELDKDLFEKKHDVNKPSPNDIKKTKENIKKETKLFDTSKLRSIPYGVLASKIGKELKKYCECSIYE